MDGARRTRERAMEKLIMNSCDGVECLDFVVLAAMRSI